MVMEFIREAAKACHIELTCLIVPGENDTEEEMDEMSRWIASLDTVHGTGRDIPLHVSRFFPRFKMTDRGPTPVSSVYSLASVATAMVHMNQADACAYTSPLNVKSASVYSSLSMDTV